MKKNKLPGIFILVLLISIGNLSAQSLVVTHDTTICQGQSVQLNVSGGSTYTWTPSGTLTGSTTATPVATPTQTTTYVVTSSYTSSNIAINGDFSAGNSGFTTQYHYEQAYDTLGPGDYTVGNSPSTWNTGYSNCSTYNHAANMLIADGSLTANVPVWCETFNVVPGTTYNLTAFFESLDESSLPHMQWMVNNTLVGNTSGTPLFECLWEKIGTTNWNSGANTTATFCLVDNLAGPAEGDDFAIDSITIAGAIALSDSVVVTVVASPVVNIGNDTSLCTGQTLTLNATTPNSTYLWSTGATTPTISVSSAGTYKVQVDNGCAVKDSIVVAYISAPGSFNLGSDTTYCGNFNRVLTTGNASTVWSTNTTAAQITVNSPGTYWATETNQCGVTADTIVISQNAAPVINLGNDTILCTAQTLTLNATYPSSTYLWSNNSTAPGITVSSAGVYWVQVNNGCIGRDSITVAYSSPPAPFFLGNDTAYCGSFSRVLITGNANTVWSTGAHAAQITINSPGTYWATETNQCGVTGDTIVISQNAAPVVNLGNDTTLCNGETLSLVANYPSSTYLWSNNSTAPGITVNSPGVYWVQVSNGCTTRDSITVAYSSTPAPFFLGNDTTYCGSFSRVLTTGNANTIWSTSANGSQITVNSSGTYWAKETNQCGSASDTIVIGQMAAPVVSLGVDTAICSAQTVLLDAGNPGSTYNWSNNTHNETIDASLPGTYSVTVTTGGCSASDSVVISSYTVPLSVTSVNTSCGAVNGTATAIITNGRGPYNYIWSTTATTSGISGLAAGTYNVTVTDANGCTATASASVGASGANSVSVTASSNLICPNDTAQLCANSGFVAYNWSNGDTTQCISTQTANDYSVTVTDVGNCTAASGITTIQVRQPPSVTVSVSGDTLTSYSASSYQWYLNDTLIPGATSGTYIAQVSGNYTVVISDSHGCTATSSVEPVTVSGIDNVMLGNNIKVYPNPLESGNWVVQVGDNFIGGSIEVFDDNGRVVYKARISAPVSILDFNSSRGIYFMRVVASDKYFSTKLVRL